VGNDSIRDPGLYSIESRNILIASSSGTSAGNLCASSKKKTGIFFAGGLGFESSFPFEAGFEELDVDVGVFEG
jgi:hypothetical protein